MPRAPSLQKLVGNLALESCSSSPSGISLGCSCSPALLSAVVARLPSWGFLKLQGSEGKFMYFSKFDFPFEGNCCLSM